MGAGLDSATAAAVPSSPYSVMTLSEWSGQYASGRHQSYDLTNSDLTVRPESGTDGFAFVGTQPANPGQTRTGVMVMIPPTGDSDLAAGTYATTPEPDNTHAGMYGGQGQFCRGPGTLVVREISRDAATHGIVSFAASYSMQCVDFLDTPNLRLAGEVRWHSAISYVDVTNTGPLDFANAYLDTTTAAQTVTITSVGPTPMQVGGPASLSGDQPEGFLITADGCVGKTLSYGQTCTVSVAAHVRRFGVNAIANLVVPNNSAGGSELVPLIGRMRDTDVGKYVAIRPSRILDTRTGLGVRKGPVRGGTAVRLQVAGQGTVRTTGVGSIVLNLTVTHPTSTSGFVTAYPSGKPRPTASTINFTRGWSGANMVTVPLGAGGRIDLYVSSGSADLVADAVGWYANKTDIGSLGDYYYPVAEPFRIMDTRHDGGVHSPLPAGYEVEMGVGFALGFDNTSVHAIAVNVTATNVTATGGYLTAYSGANVLPWKTSTLNLRAHTTTPNMAIVQTRSCISDWCSGRNFATFKVYNGSERSVDVLVDVVGYYSNIPDTGRTIFRPLANPTRIVDTRRSSGAVTFGAATTQVVNPPTAVAAYNTAALVGNLTAVAPTASTFFTVWPLIPGISRPTVSNINPRAGSTVANAFMTMVGVSEDVNVYNASGSADLLIDVAGTFENTPALDPPALGGARSDVTGPMVRKGRTGEPAIVGSGVSAASLPSAAGAAH